MDTEPKPELVVVDGVCATCGLDPVVSLHLGCRLTNRKPKR